MSFENSLKLNNKTDLPKSLKIFAKNFLYTSVQEPIDSVSQIIDKVHNSYTDSKWNYVPKIINKPNNQKFGTIDWAAQTLGSASGMILPFIVASKISGIGLKSIGLEAETTGLASKSALNMSILDSASSGAVYGALFTPSNNSDFINGKIKNAAINALSFGSLSAGSIGISKFAQSDIAKNIFVDKLLTNKIISGAISGIPAAIATTQSESLLDTGKLASLKTLEHNALSMAMIGSVFGAKSSFEDITHNYLDKNINHNKFKNIANFVSVSDTSVESANNDKIKLEISPENQSYIKSSLREGCNLLSEAMQSLNANDLETRRITRAKFLAFAKSEQGQAIKPYMSQIADRVSSYGKELIIDGYDIKPDNLVLDYKQPEFKPGNAREAASTMIRQQNAIHDFINLLHDYSVSNTQERDIIGKNLIDTINNNQDCIDYFKSILSQIKANQASKFVLNYLNGNTDNQTTDEHLQSEAQKILTPKSDIFNRIKKALSGHSLTSGDNTQILKVTGLDATEHAELARDLEQKLNDLQSANRGEKIKAAQSLTKAIGLMTESQFKQWYDVASSNLLHMNFSLGQILLKPEISAAMNSSSDTLSPKDIQDFLSGKSHPQEMPQDISDFIKSINTSNSPKWISKLQSIVDNNSQNYTDSHSLSDKLYNLNAILDEYSSQPKVLNFMLKIDNIDSRLARDIAFKLNNPKFSAQMNHLIELVSNNDTSSIDDYILLKSLTDYDPKQKFNNEYKAINEQLAILAYHDIARTNNFDQEQIINDEKAIHEILYPEKRFQKPQRPVKNAPFIDKRFIRNDTPEKQITETTQSKPDITETLPSFQPPVLEEPDYSYLEPQTLDSDNRYARKKAGKARQNQRERNRYDD